VGIIEAITKAILRTSKSLRGINRFLGGIIGIAKGALIVVIIFTIGSFFLTGDTSTGLKNQIKTNVDQSVIGKYIYDNNPIPGYITSNINLDGILGNITGLFGGDNNNPENSAEPTPSPSEGSGS
jgi:hypothetical protein